MENAFHLLLIKSGFLDLSSGVLVVECDCFAGSWKEKSSGWIPEIWFWGWGAHVRLLREPQQIMSKLMFAPKFYYTFKTYLQKRVVKWQYYNLFQTSLTFVWAKKIWEALVLQIRDSGKSSWVSNQGQMCTLSQGYNPQPRLRAIRGCLRLRLTPTSGLLFLSEICQISKGSEGESGSRRKRRTIV